MTAEYTQKPLCSTPRRFPVTPMSEAARNDTDRRAAILTSGTKWANGTILHYCFFGGDSRYAVPKEQADVIRAAFASWKATGIGLEFREVDQLGDAEVRVGFSLADGVSQSAVGRDVLRMRRDEPTTVYGWDLTTPYGNGTALHELGHVLGMEHEHQNPFTGIQWNEDKVYASLGRPPNSWSREKTFFNILRKLDPHDVQGSSWDPDSIMEYEFEAGLIAVPAKYQTGLVPSGTLSGPDKTWVQQWYPAGASPDRVLEPFDSATVHLGAGQQADFVIRPTESRKYTISTKGASDALLVLFEQADGEPRYLTADDDSGEERNASITHKLFKGRSYVLRMRVNYPGDSSAVAVLMI